VAQLPFPAGATVGVSQGFHGYDSHYDEERYAIDFPVAEGTQVVAARSGRVWRTYNHSTENCGTPGCWAQANFVLIDHGDGTFGRYWHLQHQGALVTEGQHVCKGQVIGLSGNTGISTGPHLHFDIIDPLMQTLPVAFEELTLQGGTPVAGGQYTSQNLDPGACNEDFKYSSCPQDVFKHMGITLASEIPCSAAEGGAVYPVTGRLLLPGQMARIATFVQKPGDAQAKWYASCYPADSNGNFTADLSWSPGEVVGNSWLMISAADASCHSFQGWSASPFITLQP
jgi:murein DD-endopeptidase MepM/ murein hydrolase activator NlpD